ncbi:MAG: DNA polymerase III subunit delta [Pseudomonadota bacterium]
MTNDDSMPKMDITVLSRELEAGRVASIYLLVGEERFLADRSIEMIRGKLSQSQSSELSSLSLTGKEVKANRVVEALNSMSLLGGTNTVIIRDGEKVSSNVLNDLIEYIEHPNPNSLLIIQAVKLDGRSRFVKEAQKSGTVIECKPLYQNKLPYWVSIEAKRFKKRIAQDASEYLSEIVGSDLGQLSQSLERLSYYIGERPMIELKDVEEVISETSQKSIFDLTDALGGKAWEGMLKLLNNLIENNQVPLMILSMIARHFRILVKAKELTKRRITSQEAASYLGVHPFFVERYLGQAKNFTSQELKDVFFNLSQADRKLKSSSINAQRVLEYTFSKICGMKI